MKSVDAGSHAFLKRSRRFILAQLTGFYALALGVGLFTQFVFYVVPWIQWGDRQMVLFDIGARRFYLFGMVLYPQDVIYLAALLIICALALFYLQQWRGDCGVGLAVRKRYIPKFSCGLNKKLRVIAALVFDWIIATGHLRKFGKIF